jgi:hypothetical protein
MVQGWHPFSEIFTAICPILLRATMRSNSHHSNTHLKTCQSLFTVSLGARFASMNWLTILVSSGLSDTWHPWAVKRDLDFLRWVFWA